jgi:hypothetical protein
VRSKRIAVPAAAAAVSFLGAVSAPAVAPVWMSEEAMRAAFIGKTLDGHYGNGVTWTEAYLADGRLDYREPGRKAVGNWYFRNGNVFCTFYDPPDRPVMTGGCWNTIQTGANCYEFYLAGLLPGEPGEDVPGDGMLRWNARGWRQDAPSTCQEKPSS